MKTTNTADLPCNEICSITAGAILKCDDASRDVQQDMLAKAKRYALEKFSKPNAFYHGIAMCFVAQNGSVFSWVGAHEVSEEANVCFIRLCVNRPTI